MQPHVIIVGGGFAGLHAAKALAKQPVRITLIDRRNYHLFQPLLYQVAMAGLSPGNIAAPLRGILRNQKSVRVLLGEVRDIDPDNRTVTLDDGSNLSYDYLVVATGSSHSYFGHDEWEPVAPGLKSLADALEIRQRVLLAFEKAEREQDPAARQAWLTFVVVGGGPTGVELAGALGELANYTLRGNFRSIDPSSARIYLIEGLERVLPPFDPSLSAKAEASLRRLGVTVRTKTLVTNVTPDYVVLKRGDQEEVLPCKTVLWAAGVQASPMGKLIQERTGVQLDRVGRVMVEPDLSVQGYPSLFVIGDLAHFAHGLERPLPGLAPVAMQQGDHIGRVIASRLANRPAAPFRYRDKGTMATIGRAAAVAEIVGLKLSGFIAWLTWLFVHLMYLVGFENRILVFLQWAWNYFTYKRGVRLIVGRFGAGAPESIGSGAPAQRQGGA
ncbi:MAG TPA: NAD(P)/FAD-dependent oxidoreductase [Caldilineaceae bacterium]|nr:NAD(P)/FAD-dependent oxidoreductase [Caldilineaceae bacterium]